MASKRIVMLVAGLLVAGCTAGSTAPPSPSAGPSAAPVTPSPAPTKAAITLVRSLRGGVCSVDIIKDEAVGTTEVMLEHFHCPGAVMTDPRVSGTLDMDVTTTFDPATSPAASWTATLTIANADGTWEGTGRGAVVMWSDVNGPTNYGEDIYKGTGAYAGLTYHELVAGGDIRASLSGWISEKS